MVPILKVVVECCDENIIQGSMEAYVRLLYMISLLNWAAFSFASDQANMGESWGQKAERSKLIYI